MQRYGSHSETEDPANRDIAPVVGIDPGIICRDHAETGHPYAPDSSDCGILSHLPVYSGTDLHSNHLAITV